MFGRTIATLLASLAQVEDWHEYSLIMWGVVLIAMLLALFALVALVRRWMSGDAPDATAFSSSGFTLGDLRDMHKRGLMTDEEFERAKVKIIAASGGFRARPQGPDKESPKGDGK